MELRVAEALERGIAAHREGKLQDAERFYRAILNAQPEHPDANHNLGVLAVAVGKVSDALPLFKQALETNPQVDQFWLSYIDALIKSERFDEAKLVMVKGEKSGVPPEKLEFLLHQVQTVSSPGEKKTKQGMTVSEKRKRLADKKKNKKRKTGRDFSSEGPSQAQINRLIGEYQAGRLKEAEALAVSLTQQFPKHPSGWKALGLVFNQTGKLKESLLPMRELANLLPHDAETHYNLGVTLQELSRLGEAEASYSKAIALRPDYAEAHNNLANALRELGRLDEAEACYGQAIALKPDYANAHNNLGVTLKKLGRLDEAEASYRRAIGLKPSFAEAQNNLGVTLQELGRLDEAEAIFRQAIALKHDFAQAFSNLGIVLQELGRLDEAEAICREAIALRPDFAEAHNNLGNTLRERGRLGDAIASLVNAINLKDNYSTAYANLGDALQGLSVKEADKSLSPILTNLLGEGNFVRPSNVARAILNLLKQDALIDDLLHNAASLSNIREVSRAIRVLAQFPLLHQLMRICPLPDLQIEKLLVAIRQVLVQGPEKIEVSPEIIYFLSTLSLQCFTNEYVYFQTEKEAALIRDLEQSIVGSLARASQPTITETLCLASYRPLHQYEWSDQLRVLEQVPEVQKRLIDEPRAERTIARDMPMLVQIEDSVSRKVREQYEENPYPRWVKLRISSKGKTAAKVCDEAKLKLRSESIRNVAAPKILIAGCGTGQHSIETATRFANCQVTAIDLSRASLAYAQRKTSELGVTNIEYLHADILDLGELDREFHIIESGGVLHHMDDPMAGWRVLVGLLKAGGLMRIGLYSQLARRHIAQIREEIALKGVGSSEREIRQFRRFIIESRDEHYKLLTRHDDFFSLSMLRDLIFHEHEHRFTLLQIKSCLEDLGLKFCGFESGDIVAKFKEAFGEAVDTCDLSLWHLFEERHPHTFFGMYQFWCQKL